MSSTSKVVIVAVLLSIVVVGLVFSGLIGRFFSLWPGTPGLDAGVVGYQTVQEGNGLGGYWGTATQFPQSSAAHNPLSPRYQWLGYPAVDVYNTEVQKTEDFFNGAHSQTLLVERQQPTPEDLEQQAVDYWIYDTDPQGNPRKTEITGTVVPWDFIVQLSIVPGTDQDHPYFQDGESVWLALGTKQWDRAYGPQASTNYTNYAGWSIPLSVYIEEYNAAGGWTNNDGTQKQLPDPSWVSECCQVTPSLSGRTVTLFDSPTNPVSLDDLWYRGNLDAASLTAAIGALNGTLVANPNPDSHFSNHAYFRFLFTQFKPYWQTGAFGSHLATWYPAIYYKLRVFYLQLGEFTYITTQQNLPIWDVRNWSAIFTPLQQFWKGVGMMLLNLDPFAIFGPYANLVAFIFTLFIGVIIIFVLLAIFAPWVLPRIFGAAKKSADAARGK